VSTPAVPLPQGSAGSEIGLVLTGGGARGAYQVGVLRWIARAYPHLRIPIVTGVSAGAVNAAHLSAHAGSLLEATDDLAALWRVLTADRIFDVEAVRLGRNVVRWGAQLVSGGRIRGPEVRSFLDTTPLRELLHEVLPNGDGEIHGIEENLKRGSLRAVAMMSTSYTTGQSVVWVQGRDIRPWRRPLRKVIRTHMHIDHIMASAALPLFFPAVCVDGHWYGDGGVRLSAPLSPALHLGASRILAISTRYERTAEEAEEPAIHGYPPPAQVLGVLLNAVFLDLIDQDAARLERLNDLIDELPDERRHGMKPIRLLVMRPTRDLGDIAAGYEIRLPRAFRFMIRGLGTRRTRSSDVLSMLAFVPEYLGALIELGEADADARRDEIAEFIEDTSTRSIGSGAGPWYI
jgi:NTE family protein